MSEPAIGASLGRRLRLSAWVDPVAFMNGHKDGQIFQPDIDNLFKPAFVNEALDGGRPVIDDLSLLATLRDDDSPALNIGFDPDMLQMSAPRDATPAERKAVADKAFALRKGFYNAVIKHCHEVLGVQCLIGFARTRLDPHDRGEGVPKEPRLATWFKMATPVPSIDDVTTRIVNFCEEHLPEFDGISFDLEGLAGLPAGIDVARDNVMGFYTALAEKLRNPPLVVPDPAVRPFFDPKRQYDRLVTFAAGNLIGDVKDENGVRTGTLRSSRMLKHDPDGQPSRDPDDPDDFVSATHPLRAGFAEQAQDYRRALSDRNLIVRPMSYDNFKRGDSQQVLDDWHADIVRFMDSLRVAASAGGVLALPAGTTLQLGNFQLGVKTIDGPGQLQSGMDGVMGGVGKAEGDRIKHVIARCRDLLNPHRIGICFFPTSANFWKPANKALNPSVPFAGQLIGHPVQCAIGQPMIDRLKKP
jgi:hypothetical protein